MPMDSETLPPYPDDLLERALNANVYEVAVETPLENAPLLSKRAGLPILLKREDLQPVFSFKIRGAFNKISRLSSSERARGVICASAGNHAQGVALSASRLGVRAVIVMPEITPQIKVDAVKSRGGEVVLFGMSFDEAAGHARKLEKEQGLVFVHPFDDLEVMAGQATVALEILRQHPRPIGAIFCAVGGGGLISGMAAVVKRLRPDIKIIGVEAHDADAMAQSLTAGKRISLEQVGLFADGAAVKQVGAHCFAVARKHVDEIIRVDNDAICAAIKDVFEDTRSILEPAGALGVAGAKVWAARGGNLPAVAVTSGANMNFDRLRFVAERAEVGELREAVMAVTIPEKPGAFKAFCALLGRRSITEFNYRLHPDHEAQVFVGLTVGGRSEIDELVARLMQAGHQTVDLTGDELAKTHLRHLVGGRPALPIPERLFRVVFPERPGALLTFLDKLKGHWNISLFHYRNHGADFGRVLLGIQVPAGEAADLHPVLDGIGYPWVEETDHPAVKLFLK